MFLAAITALQLSIVVNKESLFTSSISAGCVKRISVAAANNNALLEAASST